MFNINPKQMQQAMKKMGIKQEEIPASEVIIKTEDKDIIITNPSVAKIEMAGNQSFQITGDIEERESEAEISQDDISTVSEQTGCTEDEAKQALEESEGDLAKAILSIKG